MASRVVGVVGAGDSGLTVSYMLARAGVSVVLVERLPVSGGQEPGPMSARLGRCVTAAGVRQLLGTLAVSWDLGHLQTLGVQGAERLALDALVIATGSRPATRGELGLAGDRFAGVLPASAALHITESGVLLGHRPVILGTGALAVSCLQAVRSAGAGWVTIVAPDGILHPGACAADAVLDGWSVTAAHGNPRVQAVTIARDGIVDRLATDAVILAHRRVPVRNVDGVTCEDDRVIVCQSTDDRKSSADVQSNAEHAVAEALRVVGLSLGVT